MDKEIIISSLVNELRTTKGIGKLLISVQPSTIVQRLWNYCNILRDDGVSYSDYVEQLTYLLFLKMVAEQFIFLLDLDSEELTLENSWSSLLQLQGDELETHYRHILNQFGRRNDLVGVIFRKAQNKIQDPAKLRRLISLIDAETWTGLSLDVKGAIYEGLLEKNAQDIKSGAGQYFTPRPLIQAIVEVMRPQPGQTICDPACGTGGFLLAAYDYIVKHCGQSLSEEQWQHLREEAFHGWEIVDNTARLCVMNLYLHGISGRNGKSPIRVKSSLVEDPGERFDVLLSNPPFGRKSTVTSNGNGHGDSKRESEELNRLDFWVNTSNKQLNFIQHIKTILSPTGKAAVVIPDNVLFEGGAGETIRRNLLENFDVHTLLRLPSGIFYAQGVKANVVFFDQKKPNQPPSSLWVYDLRTNKNFTLKSKPLTRKDLDEFVVCFNPENRCQRTLTWSETDPQGRWRSFSYDQLLSRDKVNLDITWLRDESLEDNSNLPAPEVIAAEILADLQAALELFRELAEELEV